MPSLPYVQALAALERNPLEHRVCLLVSDSNAMVAELSRILLDAVVPHQRDFNVAHLQCTRDTAGAWIEALGEELPIMAERRLVFVRDVHLLLEAAAIRVASYLAEAGPSTWFLLTAAPSAPRRPEGAEDEGSRGSGIKRLTEAVKKLGLVVTSNMTPEEVLQWLQRELERRRVQASSTVCKTLVDRVGVNMTALSTEVEKLACFVGERKRIDVSDLDRLVRPRPSAQIFDLTNAIAARDVSRALSVLTGLLDANEPPLRLLAFLTTQYRNLIRVKALQEARASAPDIASRMGWKEAAAKRTLRVVERVSASELEQSVEALIRADKGMKSGKDPALLLELLVMHLCRVTSTPA